MSITLSDLQNKLLDLRKQGKLLLQNGDCGVGSAPSNIALIKYWGKSQTVPQTPDNPSLSFTLSNLHSTTRVTVLGRFFPENEIPNFIPSHEFVLTDAETDSDKTSSQKRISNVPEKLNEFLKKILTPFATDIALKIESHNNFPTACGIASSASGMAALCRAIANLLNLEKHFSKTQLQYWLTHWARLGSGSAARSTCLKTDSMFVSWELCESRIQPHRNSKQQLVPETNIIKNVPYHKNWKKLRHCVFVLDATEKKVGSSEGHTLAHTSPLHSIRVNNVKENFDEFKKALKTFDLHTVATMTENDALSMHAVMQTSTPAVVYLNDRVAYVISEFLAFRQRTKIKAFWTLDAGPNLHVLYMESCRRKILNFHKEITKKLNQTIKIYE